MRYLVLYWVEKEKARSVQQANICTDEPLWGFLFRHGMHKTILVLEQKDE